MEILIIGIVCIIVIFALMVIGDMVYGTVYSVVRTPCSNCGYKHGNTIWQDSKDTNLIFHSKSCSQEYWKDNFRCSECESTKLKKENPNFFTVKFRRDYYDFCNNECSNLYKEKNPAIFYVENNKRHSISSDLRQSIWNRDGGRCSKCGDTNQLEIDHIIPVSKGGATSLKNLELLCFPCNRSKSAKIE